jgi:hypothetical protein
MLSYWHLSLFLKCEEEKKQVEPSRALAVLRTFVGSILVAAKMQNTEFICEFQLQFRDLYP